MIAGVMVKFISGMWVLDVILRDVVLLGKLRRIVMICMYKPGLHRYVLRSIYWKTM